MADFYPYKETEEKWHKVWETDHTFKFKNDGRPKYYVLEMFPYPSGYLHMGHVRVYCIGDVLAHYRRMQGFDVLHPMGYDAFGLPAENAAIKNKVHPADWTYKNVNHARGQFKKMGISYDWDRELATCDKEYYKWNQWLFIKMFEKGLAYRKKMPVNWCPSCETVLANEQVQDGKCWRCESKVAQKDLTQWFFKITDYTQELLDGHKLIEKGWPEKVIAMQQNWIGKSTGVEIFFKEADTQAPINVFTTRPDTIFGATYIVLAPTHPQVEEIKKRVEAAKVKEIEEFQAKVKKMDITVLTMVSMEKEGVFTGAYAINPVNGNKIPVWIGNYVLMDYGTGAIMAVPTHDSRDFVFSKKYKLPMILVIQPEGKEIKVEKMETAYEGGGKLVNSGQFNGEENIAAKEKIADWMETSKIGKKKINYRLKDWLLSRQRYWGTPIPMIYCEKCGVIPEAEKNLPVELPRDIEFTGKGNPLETSKSFVNCKCPKCGGAAKRETDTMDTFVDSSWYFMRYCDNKNNNEIVNKTIAENLLPVDQYVGGAEHSCMHLIYARFFTKVMRDMGLIKIDEPFIKLLTQGMVHKDGNKMSKSKGNTVSPDDMIEKYGADIARLFMLFAAPPMFDLEWSDEGVEGASRFVNRLWRKMIENMENIKKINGDYEYATLTDSQKKLARKVHQTIKKVTKDIEVEQQFNTAIAGMMELYNVFSATELEVNKPNEAKLLKFVTSNFTLLLAPFVPHFAEELWERQGGTGSVFFQKWPIADEKLTVEDSIELVVQVNGKIREKIQVAMNTSQLETEKIVFASERLKEWLVGKEIVKKIYVPNKLYNIVVK